MSRTSSSWIARHYGDRCEPTLVRVPVFDCSTVFEERATPAILALGLTFAAFGYSVRSCGVYNCREIKGSSSPSSHSWAISTDINPDTNPWAPWVGGRLVTDLPPALISYVEHEMIAIASGLPAMYWGGRWSRYDPMHFQTIATPAELALGVNSPSGAIMSRYAFSGASGPSVGELQASLVNRGFDLGEWGPAGDGIDESFGDDTELALASWQAANKVEEWLLVNGEWQTQPAGKYAGPRTWAKLGRGPKGVSGPGGDVAEHNHGINSRPNGSNSAIIIPRNTGRGELIIKSDEG